MGSRVDVGVSLVVRWYGDGLVTKRLWVSLQFGSLSSGYYVDGRLDCLRTGKPSG